jgi:hypothetical protein
MQRGLPGVGAPILKAFASENIISIVIHNNAIQEIAAIAAIKTVPLISPSRAEGNHRPFFSQRTSGCKGVIGPDAARPIPYGVAVACNNNVLIAIHSHILCSVGGA